MPNILQQAEILKDVSDKRIRQEMQRPTGQFPLYLVSSEAKRRADLRQRFKAEQSGPPPQTTVQQDLMAALAGQVPPTTQPISPNRAVAPGQGPGLPLNPQGTPPTGVPPPPHRSGASHKGVRCADMKVVGFLTWGCLLHLLLGGPTTPIVSRHQAQDHGFLILTVLRQPHSVNL